MRENQLDDFDLKLKYLLKVSGTPATLALTIGGVSGLKISEYVKGYGTLSDTVKYSIVKQFSKLAAESFLAILKAQESSKTPTVKNYDDELLDDTIIPTSTHGVNRTSRSSGRNNNGGTYDN